MTQAEMERELAAATGESLDTIRRRGFQLIETPMPEPCIVDWDELDDYRTGYLPQRSQRRLAG